MFHNTKMTMIFRVLAVLVLFHFGFHAYGQPMFRNTKTVDPTSNTVDFPTIQEAINSINGNMNERWTVLIYSGTYSEHVLLGANKNNIDLVGFDGEAVIINPPNDNDAGITIKGLGVRNNLICNLTIITNNAGTSEHGIEILKDGVGAAPTDIDIENVTITTTAASSHGIVIADTASRILVKNTKIATTAGDGINCMTDSSNISVENVKVTCQDRNSVGLNFAAEVDDLVIIDPDITMTLGDGIVIGDTIQSASVVDRFILQGGTIRIQGDEQTNPVQGFTAVRVQHDADDILLADTRIFCSGSKSRGFNALVPVKNIDFNDLFIRMTGCDAKAVSFQAIASIGSSNVSLDHVVIRSLKMNAPVFIANDVTNMTLDNCDFLSRDGRTTLTRTSNVSMTNSSIVIDNSIGDDTGCNGNTQFDTAAIVASGVTGLSIRNCRLRGTEYGIWLRKDGSTLSSQVLVGQSSILAGNFGVDLSEAKDVTFLYCTIDADQDLGSIPDPSAEFYGVFVPEITESRGTIKFTACDINAYSKGASRSAVAVQVEDEPDPNGSGPIEFINCNLFSHCEAAAENSFGVRSTKANAVVLVGGQVTSIDDDDREAEQYDLKNAAASGTAILVSGTTFSKWLGPIGSVSGSDPAIQRVFNISTPNASAILPSTALDPNMEQIINANISNPDVLRVLTVSRNAPDIDSRTIIIIGENEAGERITDSITIQANESAATNGVKPFSLVTSIILPSGPATETVSVGTSTLLGLDFSISGINSVRQVSREITANGNTFYAVQLFNPGDVNDVHATINTAGLPNNSTLEFSYDASR